MIVNILTRKELQIKMSCFSLHFFRGVDYYNFSALQCLFSISGMFIHLLTQSLVIPSCQGDAIIFHSEKFLQLQGILLTHPAKVDKKRELKQEYLINKGIVIYNSPQI